MYSICNLVIIITFFIKKYRKDKKPTLELKGYIDSVLNKYILFFLDDKNKIKENFRF